jgi:hypothetical protein
VEVHLSRIPDKDAEVVLTKSLFVSVMKFDLLQLAYEHNLHTYYQGTPTLF